MVFHERKLADLALQNRHPAIFRFREFADQGGLISMGRAVASQLNLKPSARCFANPLRLLWTLLAQPAEASLPIDDRVYANRVDWREANV